MDRAGPCVSQGLLKTLQKNAEVLVEEDVGVEQDRALGHLPPAGNLPQHVLAGAGEELVIRLQMRTVDKKGSPGLYLAVVLRRRLEIADQVAGARRWILRPRHATVEPSHTHFEIAFILFEDCQVA